jgi:hypothetical protein
MSVQYLIQLFAVPFMYFILVDWRRPSEVETCCRIKDLTLTICVDDNFFSCYYVDPRGRAV